jgi:hypothetical protein
MRALGRQRSELAAGTQATWHPAGHLPKAGPASQAARHSEPWPLSLTCCGRVVVVMVVGGCALPGRSSPLARVDVEGRGTGLGGLGCWLAAVLGLGGREMGGLQAGGCVKTGGALGPGRVGAGRRAARGGSARGGGLYLDLDLDLGEGLGALQVGGRGRRVVSMGTWVLGVCWLVLRLWALAAALRAARSEVRSWPKHAGHCWHPAPEPAPTWCSCGDCAGLAAGLGLSRRAGWQRGAGDKLSRASSRACGLDPSLSRRALGPGASVRGATGDLRVRQATVCQPAAMWGT